MKKKKMINWIKTHKKELILTGVSIGTIVVMVLLIKNNDDLLKLFQQLKDRVKDVVKTDSIPLAEKSAPIIKINEMNTPNLQLPEEFLKKLTGNKLTATKLGEKVRCSNLEINNRLVDAGLAVRYPSGGYSLTETGKLVGEDIFKMNRYGCTFPNLEWDEAVLELLFSAEELQERLAMANRIREEIMSFAG